MVYYEVWHRGSTRDRSGGFRTEAEALAALRRALAAHGPAYLEEFSLVRVDTRERRTTVAEGPPLVSRVESYADRAVRRPATSRRKRAAA